MKIRRAALFALVFCLALSTTSLEAQAWEGPAAVGLRVTDEDGQPIADAQIVARVSDADDLGPPTLTTDAGGRAVISGLREGEWFIEVSHPAYMLYAAYIDLRAGKKPVVGFSSQVNTATSWKPMTVKFQKASADFRRGAATRRAEPKPPEVVRQSPPPRQTEPPKVVRPEPEPPKVVRPEAVVSAEAPAPEPTTQAPEAEEAEAAEAPIEVVEEPATAAESSQPAVTPEPAAEESEEPAPAPPVVPEPADPLPAVEPEPEAPAEAPAAEPVAVEAPVEPAAEPEAERAVEPVDTASAETTATEPAVTDPPQQTVVEAPEPQPEPTATTADPPVVEPAPAPEAPAPEAPAEEQPVPSAPDVTPSSAATPQEDVAAEPMPAEAVTVESAAESTAESTEIASATERAAAPPAPAPDPAPQPTSVRLPRFLRSAATGTCQECEPGEWAVAAEQEAARAADIAAGRECTSDYLDAVADAAQRLADTPGARLENYTGPILTAMFRLEESDSRAALQELLGAATDPASNCQMAGVVLPATTRFSGYVLEAWDSLGGRACRAKFDCAVGQARWLDEPQVVEGSERTVVYGIFKNRSSRRERRLRMTVYFRPDSEDWRPRTR